MIQDFWLNAMLDDAKRRRGYQRELLTARRQPCRPRESIKHFLKQVRIVRAMENQAAARLRQSHQGSPI